MGIVIPLDTGDTYLFHSPLVLFGLAYHDPVL